MKPAVQDVLFDVDGVLIHGYHHNPEKSICWDKNLEKDLKICKETFTEKFIFGVFTREVIVGKKNLYDALEEFLPTIGFNQGPQLVIDYWLENDANINYELLEKIKLLQRVPNIRLHIATNQEHNRAKYLMETLGFNKHFSNIFHSAEIGYRKPNPLYFVNVHQRLGAPVTPPIFFDDTPEVVESAKKFGWHAFVYNDVKDIFQSTFISTLIQE